MLRISHYLRELARAEATGHYPPPAKPTSRDRPPVVIWNLIRRCNLRCQHCYAFSADHDYPGELSTAEVFTVLDDLRRYGVPAIILSGGEPLLRPDLFEIAARARQLGFHLGLSTNGTLIDAAMARRIAAAGLDYVGISLDGLGATHDRFRRLAGAFDLSLAAVRHLRALGLKVGLRTTLTADNAQDLPGLLELHQREGLDKFYLSHLNYAGRGQLHRGRDAQHRSTRAAMDLLIEHAWAVAQAGRATEFVTGNNDADGAYLLHWARRHLPRWAGALGHSLRAWGGNASGTQVANIDTQGHVHPDTMWWHHDLGSVRERSFSAIWSDPRDALMAGLRRRPRPVTGRCGTCPALDLCNGNTRLRALRLSGDPWAEDPACYLSDAELDEAVGSEVHGEVHHA